jgi:hypothetical protein
MRKVISITMYRDASRIDMFEPERVHSSLIIRYLVDEKFRVKKFPILENRKYIFPPGTYKIVYEKSPKFKQRLWEFKGIPGRTEIKFHPGKNVSHSKGCPLVRGSDLAVLHNILRDSQEYFLILVEK